MGMENHEHIILTVKYVHGNIMCWGCFSFTGKESWLDRAIYRATPEGNHKGAAKIVERRFTF